jgi:hypothetical protein
MLYFVRQSLVDILSSIRTQLNASVLTLRLYQNDWEPSPDDDAGDYVQATFTGYAGLDLDDFAAAFLNADLKAECTAPAKVYTQTAAAPANVIYGYYATNAAGLLIYAERNPAGGVQMNQAGLTYTVVPVLTLANEGPLQALTAQALQARGGRLQESRRKRGE